VLGTVGVMLWQAPLAVGALRLELSTDTERIAVYEALPVVVTLINDGTAAIGFDPLLFGAEPYGSLRIVRPDGSTMTVRRPQLRLEQAERHHAPGVDLVRVGPGDRKELPLLVSCDWDTMAPIFTDTGVYALSARYQSEHHRAVSNEIRVRVAAPPAAERRALEMVQALETPEMIYEPELTFISRWHKRLPQLQELAELDGSRVYANYARLSLARRHVILAEGSQDRAERESNLVAASALLDSIDAEEFTLAHLAEAARARVKQVAKQNR
jgi:hypothetical protein